MASSSCWRSRRSFPRPLDRPPHIRLAYPDPFIVYYRPSDPAFAQPLRALAWFKYVGACYLVRDALIGGAQETYYGGLIESLRRASTGVLIPAFRSADGRTQVFKLRSCA